jgi:hypothetical protein
MKYSGKLELTWVNKDKETQIEPRILIEKKEFSYGDVDSENLLIHGDNLIALKALESEYFGKVKAKKDVRNEEVLEKAKVGIRWCKYASTCDPDKKKWHYLLVADDVIEEGNSLKHTLGLAESIGE